MSEHGSDRPESGPSFSSEPSLLGDMPSGPPPGRPWWQGTPVLVGLAIAVVVSGGVLVWVLMNRGLAGSDPHGAEACDQLQTLLADPPGDARARLNLVLSIGEEAGSADTASIRAAAGPLFDADTVASMRGNDPTFRQMYAPDSKALHAACVGAGVEMPAYRELPRAE